MGKKKQELFYNRDVSWLDFNGRVLNEALDPRTPLLERLRFIDIFRSNNDEFFMKRIGSILNKIKKNQNEHDAELYEQFKAITSDQHQKLHDCFEHEIKKELAKQNIDFTTWTQLSKEQRAQMTQYFEQNIFPMLTPLAVSSGQPFPFLSNLSKSIALSLQKAKGKKKHFARVKIPDELPQWIRVKQSSLSRYSFISIEDVISQHLDRLFPGMLIEKTMLFRVTRNAAIEGEDEDVDDLMEMVAEGIKVRKFAPVVRLEYQNGKDGDNWLLNFLVKELKLKEDRLYPTQSFLRYTNFKPIIALRKAALKYPSFSGKAPKAFHDDAKGSIFNRLTKKDELVHFPYESYSDSVETLLKNAVYDPKVRAIKMTLYRTDEDGRLIDLLIKAADRKIQVACIVELKARFDEERNIKWGTALEEAGIHVSYGQASFKTHAKMLLVVRQENKGLKTYLNIGTGNYNSQTSKLYTDMSFFTSNKEICDDALYIFNYLTGQSLQKNYQRLLVAPVNMHARFIELIEYEIKCAKRGRPARIMAKMNSLEEKTIIHKLYEASQAGVSITLIVRGFCCLKPGIKGLSDNIKVFSLVGRLLEHSRIFYFQHDQDDPINGHFYLGSADWMYRNLFNRLEVITPIKERAHRKLLWDLLTLTQQDNRHLWELEGDGHYRQRQPQDGAKEINAQLQLLRQHGCLP